jgi:hypothetical protein
MDDESVIEAGNLDAAESAAESPQHLSNGTTLGSRKTAKSGRASRIKKSVGA